MWKEFKEFISKGNIVDLAIGVIIGGSFQKIVTSLVNDIIMPTISIFTGKIDLSNIALNIGDISIKYGAFLTTILNFLIIALSIFLAIRYLNRLNNKVEKVTVRELEKINKKLGKKYIKLAETAVEPTTKNCPYCLSEINFKATKCPHCTSDIIIQKDSTVLDKQISIDIEPKDF